VGYALVAFLGLALRFGTADVLTMYIGLRGKPFSALKSLNARQLHTWAHPKSASLSTNCAPK
jgi:hypothetical protein